jgi:hypothetical protein
MSMRYEVHDLAGYWGVYDTRTGLYVSTSVTRQVSDDYANARNGN